MRSFFLAALLLLFAACPKPSGSSLRGRAEPSPDGRTYFVLDEDSGGCRLLFDGKPWTGKLRAAVPVKPGVHTLDCEGASPPTAFEVPAGTTFHFDYFGP